VINPLLSGAIIFSSLIALLSLGLTLTYLTTKVSNFAHGAFAAIGAYLSLTVVNFFNGHIYQYLFLALIVGGVVGISQYLLVFKPLIRRGASNVVLMVATIGIELVLLAILNIYADYLSKVHKIYSRFFLLKELDITIAGESGLLVIAPTLTIITATVLYLVLTRTKFGIAMRAAIEDPSLASVMGINVDRVYTISWFIAGGLGTLSGALLPLWTPGFPEMSARLIVGVFAASIIGGLYSIYGAILGGYLVGLSEVLGTSFLVTIVGAEVIPYRSLIPLIAIIVTLLLAPKGIMGVNWENVISSIRNKVSEQMPVS
jgi:branched-chain amino acid transport system permease protein